MEETLRSTRLRPFWLPFSYGEEKTKRQKQKKNN
jgi:hypothetical protein